MPIIAKSAAATPLKISPMGIEELEFKAAFFHDLWISRKKVAGKHYPDYHNNPMVVPPPLRDDGKTRCDGCCLLMAPYRCLPEKDKQPAREIVLSIQKSDELWRNHAAR